MIRWSKISRQSSHQCLPIHFWDSMSLSRLIQRLNIYYLLIFWLTPLAVYCCDVIRLVFLFDSVFFVNCFIRKGLMALSASITLGHFIFLHLQICFCSLDANALPQMGLFFSSTQYDYMKFSGNWMESSVSFFATFSLLLLVEPVYHW